MTDAAVASAVAPAAAIKRRYYLLMASPFVIDVGMSLIFVIATDAWPLLARNIAGSFIAFVLGTLLLARSRFRPISRFLDTGEDYEGVQRALTQLPLRSAMVVGLLALILETIRLAVPAHILLEELPIERPTLLDTIAVIFELSLFYFIFTYFVISDYLARLNTYIFERWNVTLGLYFGRFSVKLGVALLVASVGPLVLILVDVLSYTGDRVRQEILVDAASALFGCSVVFIFLSRSLTRPIRILTDAMEKAGQGDLGVRVPVTSNDEVGRLTSQFNRMTSGLQDREFIRETFGKYVSEGVASRILNDRGRLSGDVRQATLMFVDIEGFTTLAERLEPHQVIALLNEYTALVLEPIRARAGVVNNFIGDGIFASFNLPLDNPDHARDAILAAIEITRLVDSHVFDGGQKIVTRIGINTGVVVAGTVGSAERLTYSILGDPVNVAHRVEEMNKEVGSRLLVTAPTRELAGEGFDFEALGAMPVRGKRDTVQIYRVVF